MLQAMSITLREGFEAALVIGILLTYASRTGRSYLRAPILWGAVAAVAVSMLVGLGLNAAGIAAENEAVEGVLYVVASLFVFSMVAWMWRAGGAAHERITSGVDRATSESAAASWGVAVVAFFMVAREGAETVLFITANALDQGLVPTIIGGAIGLGIAFALGAAVYFGAARIDFKLFFGATSVALILLATRFLGLGLLELAEAGVLMLPEAVEEWLELLEAGGLSTVVSLLVVGLPLGALGWSLIHSRPARPAL